MYVTGLNAVEALCDSVIRDAQVEHLLSVGGSVLIERQAVTGDNGGIRR